MPELDDSAYTLPGEALPPIERDEAEEVNPFDVTPEKPWNPDATDVTAELERSGEEVAAQAEKSIAEDRVSAWTEDDITAAVDKLAQAGKMPALESVPASFWDSLDPARERTGDLSRDMLSDWNQFHAGQLQAEAERVQAQKRVNDAISELVSGLYLDEQEAGELGAELMESGGFEALSPFLDSWLEIDPTAAGAFIAELQEHVSAAQLHEEQQAIAKAQQAVTANADVVDDILAQAPEMYHGTLQMWLNDGGADFLLSSPNVAVAEQRAVDIVRRVGQLQRELEAAEVKAQVLAPSTDIGSGWEWPGGMTSREHLDEAVVFTPPDFSKPLPPTQAERQAADKRAMRNEIAQATSIGDAINEFTSAVAHDNAKRAKPRDRS